MRTATDGSNNHRLGSKAGIPVDERSLPMKLPPMQIQAQWNPGCFGTAVFWGVTLFGAFMFLSMIAAIC